MSSRADSSIAAHPDSELEPDEVRQLHTRLLEERDRVADGLRRHVAGALEDQDSYADEVDQAAREEERSTLVRMADDERRLLDEIDAALDRLGRGEYGVCEGTEEPIGFARLRARPWTRYSVAYKERLERENPRHHRM